MPRPLLDYVTLNLRIVCLEQRDNLQKEMDCAFSRVADLVPGSDSTGAADISCARRGYCKHGHLGSLHYSSNFILHTADLQMYFTHDKVPCVGGHKIHCKGEEKEISQKENCH